MSIGASATNNSLGYTSISHSVTPTGGHDTLVGVGAQASPRWVDKDNNGKIDIEVDFNAGAGERFNAEGFKKYQNYTGVQVEQTLKLMNEIQVDTNLAFHQKGEIYNPDGKVTFGRYAPQTGKKQQVVVGVPNDEGAPVEVYIRAGGQKDGQALTRALLQSLGLRDPNPDKYSKVPASAVDSQGYSALSRQPETTTGHDFKGHTAVLPRITDMEELVRLYGRNSDIEDESYEITSHLDELGGKGKPITATITTEKAHEVIDARNDPHDQEWNLNPGTFSSVGGFKKNVALSSKTEVEDVFTGSGTNTVIASAVANQITLGAGANKVVYNTLSDASRNRPDEIIGFKTGVDKLDVSHLWTYPPYVRFEIENNQDGSTWVKGWAGADKSGPVPDQAPDFLLRADGVERDDLIQNAIGI